MLVLMFVGGFLIFMFVGGFLIHSCDLRHRIIFFGLLFWCSSEVCVGILGITNWVSMPVVESGERWLSVSFSKIIDTVDDFLGYR